MVLFGVTNFLYGQTEKVSGCLELVKLTESTYIHTCNYNNGVVYIDNGQAVIISTPDSDEETQHLIDWVKNKAQIVGYIVDRWHPDAMGGLNVVLNNSIKSYSNERTRRIAKEKGLPIPNVGFKEKLEIDVGQQKVICHYLGEAHTPDGIVVWIPSEKILFGGNEIRNNNGWLGNIADANLSEWSKTAQRVKEHYDHAKFVVPGHGKYGGIELIDYTINLYDFPKKMYCSHSYRLDSLNTESPSGFDFFFTSKEQNFESSLYLDAKASLGKTGKQFEIYADSITYFPSKRSVHVPSGCITVKENNRIESFFFNQLYGNLRDDEVELTVIIKAIK